MTTPQPPVLNDASHTIAKDFEGTYIAYDLGPVPGLGNKRIGGCAVKPGDPSKLIIAADAETANAQIYEIGITRDQCGHIVSFVGMATSLVAVPNADATIVMTSSGNLLFPIYPLAQLSQVETKGWTLTDTWSLNPPFQGWANSTSWTDGQQSPGGLAFVPASIVPGAKLRAVGYPEGDWAHIELVKKASDPALYDFVQATKTGIVIPNGPGGFAYVPAGSSGFEKNSIIVTEWLMGAIGPLVLGDPQKVVVYEVDANGDPIVGTRKEFFSAFHKPWGAYFDEVTGDFMFMSWAVAPDHIAQVRGFAKPPPPPIPN
jgi:hypothetical protein